MEKKPTTRGRPVNLYLNPKDEQQIRTLAAFIASAGHRVSDSLVVKAALRSARPDANLLAGVQDALASDGRHLRGGKKRR
jgi:hypothetical protein